MKLETGNWKNIWNKEGRVNVHIHEMLIKADGFDSPTGSFTQPEWLEYTEGIMKHLEITNTDSLYEVGSGSGAFLFPFYLAGHKVAGLDYSSVLINLARKIMPEMSFDVSEAVNLNTSIKYDVVFSNGVFFYFDSLDYAKTVLLRMVDKANKKVAILDINDLSKESIYHAERMKCMSESEYREKYTGLDHLFFEKEWFYNFADENGLSIKMWDQDFDRYSNSKFRFNVVLEK